jgi:hypothetical protein
MAPALYILSTFFFSPKPVLQHPQHRLSIYIRMEEKKIASEHAAVLADLSDVAAGDVELQGFDEGATKKLLRKLDWHIIPFMSLIYL